MAVDTPARIAVLGAGPIGLEAALYARYLGYEVDIYERGRVGEHVRSWGHAPLFTPFAANSSPLGLAALATQDEAWQLPQPNALLTGREYLEQYLAPLAASDLLVDSLHEQTEVLSVGRVGLLKGEGSEEHRIHSDFRLLLQHTQTMLATQAIADVVIDATGIYGQHNWLGDGGVPALGEPLAASHIQYGLPDVTGGDRESYAHRHTLVVGSGPAAARTVTALARLAHEAPYTRITWIPRRALATADNPISRIDDDPWPLRDERLRAANELIRSEAGHLAYWPGTAVARVLWHGGLEQFQVQLTGDHTAELAVDRIVANVGYRPNHRLYRELQVAIDPLTEASTRWPATTGEQGRGAPTSDPAMLLTAEPDFYVLGAKSLGRDTRFTIAVGLDQIRQLFTIIGDRPELNLYSGALEPRAQ